MFIGAGVSVASKYGLPVLFGSQIIAGIVIIIIGFGLKKYDLYLLQLYQEQ